MRQEFRVIALAVAALAGVLGFGACNETVTPVETPGVAPPRMHSGENHSPSAVITIQDFARVESINLKMHAIGSADPDRDVMSYAWDFGDGGGGSGREVSHTYRDNGAYTVKLTVTDQHGTTASTSTLLRIANAGPEPGSLTVPAAGVKEGQSFNLSVTGARDVSLVDNAAGFDYQFDCGNGVWTAFSRTASVVCAGFPDNGTYPVAARVRDKDRGSARTSRSISVANVPPAVTAGTAVVGRNVTVSFSWTDVVADAVATALVSWGDGTNFSFPTGPAPTVSKATHTYAPGPHTITLTVTDKDGGSTATTLSVTVQ